MQFVFLAKDKKVPEGNVPLEARFLINGIEAAEDAIVVCLVERAAVVSFKVCLMWCL